MTCVSPCPYISPSVTSRPLSLLFSGLATNQFVDEHYEVVDETLSVEEVVGTEQEPPAEGAEPGQAVDPVHGVADVDYLGETLHLHGQDLRRRREPGFSYTQRETARLSGDGNRALIVHRGERPDSVAAVAGGTWLSPAHTATGRHETGRQRSTNHEILVETAGLFRFVSFCGWNREWPARFAACKRHEFCRPLLPF